MKGHVARKRFGQNFLVDGGIINAIVSAIDPQRGDTVVEIGPGLGAITEPLLARLDHLHVVEIDRDLIARLKKQHPPARMTIHEGDALAFDFASIGRNLRLVGNLPYNISTPLLFHLAAYVGIVRDMHFMLQKEVVERMVAVPGNSDFSRISVMLQYRFHLEWLIDVPPESFDPPPKVQSAVVRLIPKDVAELNAKSQEKLVASRPDGLLATAQDAAQYAQKHLERCRLCRTRHRSDLSGRRCFGRRLRPHRQLPDIKKPAAAGFSFDAC